MMAIFLDYYYLFLAKYKVTFDLLQIINYKSKQKQNNMYNGIGLQSARGSGTSGHIQKNQSQTVWKNQNRQQFVKKLQQLRKNNLPPPRKANEQIIQHQRKRQILIQVMKLRQKLEDQGLLNEKEIQEKVAKAEKLLKQKLQSGQMQTKAKDTHILTKAKQKEYVKLSEAFGIQKKQQIGAAFNFQSQREQKLKRQYEKSLKQRFECPHQNCGKRYDEKQYLQRHLKYKHPKQIKSNSQK